MPARIMKSPSFQLKPAIHAAIVLLFIQLVMAIQPPVSAVWAGVMNEQNLEKWINELTDPSPDVRAAAARKIGLLGPRGAPAINDLIMVMGDQTRQVHIQAEVALSRIGPAAAPYLIEALTSENENTRMGAALALGKIRPTATEAIPRLIMLLMDDNPEVVKNTTYTLRRIGRAAEPDLQKAIDSDDPGLAKAASEILEKIQTTTR